MEGSGTLLLGQYTSIMKVWFITGSSAGFGLEMVEQLIARGDAVVATARRPEVLAEYVSAHPDRVIAPRLDVNLPETVESAVAQALAKFGRIDVLVNNAGYGLVGTVEEVTDAEARAQFDTNVFGALNVMRAVLPTMREQGSGHILNISSIAGLVAGATFPLYSASKHALEAISEGLAASVGEFGIKVTIIEPGGFRTRFADSQSIRLTENRLPAYDAQMTGTLEWLESINGAQEGDPVKGVASMIAVTELEEPPLRLMLGNDAWERYQVKKELLERDFERMKDVTLSTAADA